jgi:hypothetical protein
MMRLALFTFLCVVAGTSTFPPLSLLLLLSAVVVLVWF